MTQTFALPTWYQTTGYNFNDGHGWAKKFTPSVVDISVDNNPTSSDFRTLFVDSDNPDNKRYFHLNKKICKDKITNEYWLETWEADDLKNAGFCKIEVYCHPKTKNWLKIKFIFSNQEIIFKLKEK